jgi:hypothetical protein
MLVVAMGKAKCALWLRLRHSGKGFRSSDWQNRTVLMLRITIATSGRLILRRWGSRFRTGKSSTREGEAEKITERNYERGKLVRIKLIDEPFYSLRVPNYG